MPNDAFLLLLIQWVGAALGASGALLLAFNRANAGTGWLFFLASNVCWIGYGVLTSAWGLVAMQIVFTATSLLGIWNWLVAPALARWQRERSQASEQFWEQGLPL